MAILLQNPYFLTAIALSAIIFVLFFMLMRRNRDLYELQQDLHKNTLDYNQLVEKFDQLTVLKSQQDLMVVQLQTKQEYLQNTLLERDQNLQQQSLELSQTQANLNVARQQVAEFKISLAEKEKSLFEQQQTFVQSKQQLTVEFQNLANRILEEKSRSFNQSNQLSLEALLKPFREQIEGFQKRVNEIHSESLKGNAGLEAEIKKLLATSQSMSQQAENLTSALKGQKKTLGNWGEIQLERALQLSGLIENQHYQAQAHCKNDQGKVYRPDFVVYLPDNKHLIIDSKMSLVAYERAVNAEKELQAQHLCAHIEAIRQHINDLAKKDYSNLIGMRSPNFVLMFIAVEPAYIEALKNDPELFNFAYQKNVILVSHTTLMPILRTVANLWRVEQGNKEAREISERAGDIYNQVCLVAERLTKLGDCLSTVGSHYNKTVIALVGQQGLVGKVKRFKSLSTKANKTMSDVKPLHQQINNQKLVILKGVENDSCN